MVTDEDAPTCRRVDAANEIEQSGLTAPGRAGNRHEQALLDIKIDRSERGYELIAQAILLADVLDPYQYSLRSRCSATRGYFTCRQ